MSAAATCPTCGHAPAPAQQPLTEQQAAVLAFVRSSIAAHGFAPSFSEIGREFQYTSLATVHEHLSNLERKGYITRRYNEERAVSLVDAVPVAAIPPFMDLAAGWSIPTAPVTVPADAPALADRADGVLVRA